MNESIFRFLIESGFPRASIVTDIPTHRLSLPGSGVRTSVASGTTGIVSTFEYRPDYMIVDPESSEVLALIDIVESSTPEAVVISGTRIRKYAKELPDKLIQTFVMQIDPTNLVKDRQVRFFRIAVEDNAQKKIVPISNYAFPDLDALRVARKLTIKSKLLAADPVDDAATRGAATASAKPLITAKTEARTTVGSGLVYGLALLLLAAAVVDWFMLSKQGSGVFSLQQTLLLISASFLLAAARLHQAQKR